MESRIVAVRWMVLAVAAALLVGVGVGAASAADAQEIPGPVSSVQMHLGRPAFFVDGQPFTRPLFSTYQPKKELFAQMAKAGFTAYNFEVPLTAMWTGPDQFDFAALDTCARNILEACPGALIMPRIYLQAPEWWKDQHPEELMILDHGGAKIVEPFKAGVAKPGQCFESIASARWREEGGAALAKAIEHIQASDWADRIFAYEFSGLATEEWYYFTVNQEHNLGDYSEHMRRAFAQWLETKYGAPEALAAAWGKPGLDFPSVAIPSREERIADRDKTFRDPATQMNVIDFYLFYNDMVPDTIGYFAHVIKTASKGTKAVGTYYSYLYEFRGNPEFGHNATHALLECPDIDFICAPPDYLDRKPGGFEGYRRPYLSGTLNGKLWFHDNDSVSFRIREVMAQHHFDENGLKEMEMYHPEGGATAQASIWDYQRSAGFVLHEGIYQGMFDLHGGYYDHPQLIQGIRPILDLLDRAKDTEQTSVAQILVVADEASCSYMGFQIDRGDDPWNSGLGADLAQFQPGFLRCGAPFDSVLLEDLSKTPVEPYKLIVFLNTFHMDDAAREFVNTRLKKDGRSLLWIYAPGLFNGNGSSVEAMQQLVGMQAAPSADESFVPAQFELTPEGSQWMSAQQVEPTTGAIGSVAKNRKVFAVEDASTEVLGKQLASNTAAFARKDMGEWTSYYAITPVFSPEIVRALAKASGVHVYSEANDALYVNKSYITVHAAAEGSRTLTLPQASDISDAFTGELLYERASVLNLSLMRGQTVVLRYTAAK